METIELKLSLTEDQFKAIYKGLKALTKAMSAIMADKVADNMADKERERNKEKETNTNTYKDYKTRVETLISNLASNTNIDTLPRSNASSDANTYKDTLIRNNTSASATDNNINNINNNIHDVDDDDEEANNVVNNTTTYIDTGIPTLEEITKYVNVHKYQMSPQKFYDYYKQRKWRTKGGVSIVGQWKGFVDNWAKNEFAPKQQTPQAGSGTVEERRAAHPFVPSFDV